jgi:NAD(P)H-dependent flavin oxidoreductase YrpB (nitropropane dioxygenase family)
MLATRFTELVGCRLPLQQAGMGGVTTPALALAVTEAGGLGMLAGASLPPDALAALLDGLRGQTDGAFGVNFLMPFVNREAVRAAATRARLVEFFYGDPDPELVELVHAGGALACWQAGSRAEAVAAVRAGCDLIVAQGVEAGGHVRGVTGLLPLLESVLDDVNVPVLAAGGIGTGRAMAAALAAGAAGVRVGTRFVLAAEADAHPAYQDALIAAEPEDTVLTEAFAVRWPDAPHRVLRSCLDAAHAFTGATVGTLQRGDASIAIPRFATVPPTRATSGEVAAMALYAGESVGAARTVQPAAEIVRELVDEAAALLGRWGVAATA